MKLPLLAFALLTATAFASEHPGNTYLTGEPVRLAVPAAWTSWRVIDVEGKEIATGTDHTADLGPLPTGYYELRPTAGGADRVTAAVLAPVTPSETTPIALDTGMAWFYSDPEQVRDACALCRRAGVTWVRDRASWPELQPARDTWAPVDTRYERTLRLEHGAGMKVLQVNHASPAWAAADGRRFPEDLRDVYQFYRGLARRWKGLADAIEPWNEPDLDVFGGHTGSEIASFQKAAYLGLKAGNPEMPVNLAVFAIDRPETLDDFGANDVGPYFDRYDLHHYKGLPQYPILYGRHRALSAGRPMWTTEFNLTIKWADEKTKEPSDEQLRVQGYRVGKTFATALHEGPEKAFYFILGDYVERDLQYGLVHKDLTPRPAYVAMAAVGRLLADARPLGRVDFGDEKLKAYAFRTRVDGADRETVVAWSETWPTTVAVGAAERAYDYLGRELPNARSVELTRATVFFLLPPGGTKSLKLVPPPVPAAERPVGRPSPVVLQLLGPPDTNQSAFRPDVAHPLRLAAYNFGPAPAEVVLHVEGATCPTATLRLAPGDRVEQPLTLASSATAVVAVRGTVPDAPAAVVSARVETARPTTRAAK